MYGNTGDYGGQGWANQPLWERLVLKQRSGCSLVQHSSWACAGLTCRVKCLGVRAPSEGSCGTTNRLEINTGTVHVNTAHPGTSICI